MSEIPDDPIAVFDVSDRTVYVDSIDFAAGEFHCVAQGPHGRVITQRTYGFVEFQRMYDRNSDMYRVE